MMFLRSIIPLAISDVLFGISQPVFAQNPAALQVSGGGVEISFTLENLDALPQVAFSTTTAWTDGLVDFEGPSLASVLQASGLDARELILTALDNYTVTMQAPSADATYPIIATRMNGDIMSVRDKGPLWVVYPYDSDPDYRSETVYFHSIWQLDRIAAVE